MYCIKFLFSNNKCIAGSFLIIIGIFGFNVFGLLTIQTYSPTHRTLFDTITSFLIWITSLIDPSFIDEKDGHSQSVLSIIKNSISFIITFIGLSIFLEIIIINVFGMNTNTIKAISERVSDENNGNFMQLLRESESSEKDDYSNDHTLNN